MNLPQLPPRLLMAVAIGDLSYVKRFVEEGDDINAVGDGGMTPLRAAIETGNVDIVKYLLEKKAKLPPEDELPILQDERIRRLIESHRDWNVSKQGVAAFAAAAEHPSLSNPGSPIQKLNRDVVGNIASYLHPSGTAPRARAKTAGNRRRPRKQTRRRK